MMRKKRFEPKRKRSDTRERAKVDLKPMMFEKITWANIPATSTNLISATIVVGSNFSLCFILLPIATSPKKKQQHRRGKGTYFPGIGMHLVLSKFSLKPTSHT